VDNLANRYTSVAEANLTYNAAGSLTKDRQGYEYEYDYENRTGASTGRSTISW